MKLYNHVLFKWGNHEAEIALTFLKVETGRIFL